MTAPPKVQIGKWWPKELPPAYAWQLSSHAADRILMSHTLWFQHTRKVLKVRTALAAARQYLQEQTHEG